MNEPQNKVMFMLTAVDQTGNGAEREKEFDRVKLKADDPEEREKFYKWAEDAAYDVLKEILNGS